MKVRKGGFATPECFIIYYGFTLPAESKMLTLLFWQTIGINVLQTRQMVLVENIKALQKYIQIYFEYIISIIL